MGQRLRSRELVINIFDHAASIETYADKLARAPTLIGWLYRAKSSLTFGHSGPPHQSLRVRCLAVNRHFPSTGEMEDDGGVAKLMPSAA